MKLFKRLRGFLRRRIPFYPKKKKDKVTDATEGFGDVEVNEIYKDTGEICNVEDIPTPSEKSEEEVKSYMRVENEINFNDDARKKSDDCVEIPPNETVVLNCTLPTEKLKKESNCNIGLTVDFKEDVKYQSTEKVNIFPENSVLADLSPPKKLDEDLENHNYLSTEQSNSCDDDNEKAKDNRKFFAETIEIVNNSLDQDNNSEFEVDFEKAFGLKIQDLDVEDSWYHLSSKQIQNFEHSLDENFDCRFASENDKELDPDFDAVFQRDAVICRKSISYPASEGFEYSDVDELYEGLVDESYNVELNASLTSEKASVMIKKKIRLNNKKRVNLDELLPPKTLDKSLEDDCLSAQQLKSCDEDSEKCKDTL